jgi:acetate kinase
VPPQSARNILTINTGSSSVKAGLYQANHAGPALRISMLAERIGLPDARFRVFDHDGQHLADQHRELPDFGSALEAVFEQTRSHQIGAIGHRVVHGGSRYAQPERVGPELLDALRALVPIDPMHLPQAIGSIDSLSRLVPNVPQVACFDCDDSGALLRAA